MKRCLCFLLLCLLLPVQVFAQTEPALKLSVRQEDMIYVTVSLEGGVEGISLGVTAEIDHLLLESVPDASQWKVQGLLSDFNDRGQGVWTTDKLKTLEGELVVLAFRPRSAEPFETKITCTLIVKNGAQEVGRYSADTTVKMTKKETSATQPTVGKPTTPVTKPTEAMPTTLTTVPATTAPAVTGNVTTDQVGPETTGTTAATQPSVGEGMSAEPPDDSVETNNTWIIWVLVGIGALAVAVGGPVMRRRDLQ